MWLLGSTNAQLADRAKALEAALASVEGELGVSRQRGAVLEAERDAAQSRASSNAERAGSSLASAAADSRAITSTLCAELTVAAELKRDELDRELQALRAAADAPDSDDDSDDSMLTQPPLSDDFEITAKPVAARTRSQRG